MLTQIYEISSAREAAAISAMGVDHIGVLVGDGSFPREQSPAGALQIAASIRPPAKFSALFLSPDIAFIVRACRELQPAIVHLGSAPRLVTPGQARELKRSIPGASVMRTVPVLGAESIDIALHYEGIADFLLLDSYRAADEQIGALGVTHDWSISGRSLKECARPSSWPADWVRTTWLKPFAWFAPPASTPRRRRTKVTRISRTCRRSKCSSERQSGRRPKHERGKRRRRALPQRDVSFRLALRGFGWERRNCRRGHRRRRR
jgi:phosphoribosylanthranilate isomerase